MKILKVLESHERIMKMIENLKFIFDNNENHENHKIPQENYENHEARITKIKKI